jgi:hypothetical protein
MPKPRNWKKGRYANIVKLIGKELKPGVCYVAIIYKDFSCTPHGFMSQLYAMARDHNLKVSCAATATRVMYRFYAANSPWKPNMQAFPVVIRAKRDEERGVA